MMKSAPLVLSTALITACSPSSGSEPDNNAEPTTGILSSAPSGTPIPENQFLTIDGTEWLQTTFFRGFTWHELNDACPGGECVNGATLNGYDVTGLTWANCEEVTELFNYYLGEEAAFETCSSTHWQSYETPPDELAAFFADGWQAQSNSSSMATLHGWNSRDEGELGGVAWIQYGKPGATYPQASWMETSYLQEKTQDYAWRGAWFFRASEGSDGVPTYSCTDNSFNPPFHTPLTLPYSSNGAIPVKAVLQDEEGNHITEAWIDTPPVINVSFKPSPTGYAPPPESYGLLPHDHANENNIMHYLNPQWVTNLSTKHYKAAGLYTVTIVEGDTSYKVDSESCSQFFTRMTK